MINNYSSYNNSKEQVKDYQAALYNSLEKKGILDNLKTQIRASLIKNFHEEKQNNTNTVKIIRSKLEDFDFTKVKGMKTSVGLIKDFFNKYSLVHTLSVFLVEIGFKDTEFYSENELKEIIYKGNSHLNNLDKENEREKINNYISNEPLLVELIAKIIAMNNKQFEASGTQTSNGSLTSNLDDKLAEVDKKHFNTSLMLEQLLPGKVIEEKLLKYQRDYEQRYKVELEREIQQIKNIEMSNMRLEEHKKYSKMVEELRGEYEEKYYKRLEQLRKNEEEFNQKIAVREKDLETRSYYDRQKTQEELKRLALSEEELKKKYENLINKLKIDEEKLSFQQKEVLYIKENSVKKVQEEIEAFKIEFLRVRDHEKQEFIKKKEVLEAREFQVTLFNEKLKKLEKDNLALENSDGKYKQRVKDLEDQLFDIKRDNENLRQQLKTVVNSEQRAHDINSSKDLEIQHYKDEINTLKNSLETQKRFLEERKNEYGSLIDNLRKQLNENDVRNDKIKEEFNLEYDRLKKYYSGNLEREHDMMKEKQNEHMQMIELLKDNLTKYKNLYTKLSRKAVESELLKETGVTGFNQFIQNEKDNNNNFGGNNYSNGFSGIKFGSNNFNSNTNYNSNNNTSFASISHLKANYLTHDSFKDVKLMDHLSKLNQLEKEFDNSKFNMRSTFHSKRDNNNVYNTFDSNLGNMNEPYNTYSQYNNTNTYSQGYNSKSQNHYNNPKVNISTNPNYNEFQKEEKYDNEYKNKEMNSMTMTNFRSNYITSKDFENSTNQLNSTFSNFNKNTQVNSHSKSDLNTISVENTYLNDIQSLNTKDKKSVTSQKSEDAHTNLDVNQSKLSNYTFQHTKKSSLDEASAKKSKDMNRDKDNEFNLHENLNKNKDIDSTNQKIKDSVSNKIHNKNDTYNDKNIINNNKYVLEVDESESKNEQDERINNNSNNNYINDKLNENTVNNKISQSSNKDNTKEIKINNSNDNNNSSIQNNPVNLNNNLKDYNTKQSLASGNDNFFNISESTYNRSINNTPINYDPNNSNKFKKDSPDLVEISIASVDSLNMWNQSTRKEGDIKNPEIFSRMTNRENFDGSTAGVNSNNNTISLIANDLDKNDKNIISTNNNINNSNSKKIVFSNTVESSAKENNSKVNNNRKNSDDKNEGVNITDMTIEEEIFASGEYLKKPTNDGDNYNETNENIDYNLSKSANSININNNLASSSRQQQNAKSKQLNSQNTYNNSNNINIEFSEKDKVNNTKSKQEINKLKTSLESIKSKSKKSDIESRDISKLLENSARRNDQSMNQSYNKFNNLNFDYGYDQEDADEIKTEKNDDGSENYGDFEVPEDVKNTDIKDSIDIDFIKSSINNNINSHSKENEKDKEKKQSANNYKSSYSSYDYKFDKFTQSKTNDVIEENIELDSSLGIGKTGIYNNNSFNKTKSEIIEEDSSLMKKQENLNNENDEDKYNYGNVESTENYKQEFDSNTQLTGSGQLKAGKIASKEKSNNRSNISELLESKNSCIKSEVS